MLHVLRPYCVAFKRLAIGFIITFIAADLYPHPSLSPGIIISTVSSIRSANVTDSDISDIDQTLNPCLN